ncbi:MAG: hypothetical protein M1825_002503 [Sarcosagium campestre]|nr:MAG: hypothetical protein M1825_002503 [Sarcosagium campestre]
MVSSTVTEDILESSATVLAAADSPVGSGLASTIGHLKSSASNFTSYFTPSPRDLVLAIPRLAHRAGVFAFYDVPEQIDDVLARGFGRTVIAESTVAGASNLTSTAVPAQGFAQGIGKSIAGATASAAHPSTAGGMDTPLGMGFYNIRNFGSVFTYLTSRWALACCAVAIILNRTQIYASARRRMQLHWPLRLAIRGVPVLVFLYQALRILQTVRCQTSPDYALYRYGNSSIQRELDFAGDGGAIYAMSSSLLFWQSDEQSCSRAGMSPDLSSSSENNRINTEAPGSLSRLWPLFEALCVSQFIETLSCAIQNRQVKPETGMTIFEHSLAFAESEAMIANRMGWGPFSAVIPDSPNSAGTEGVEQVSGGAAVSRSAALLRANAPPEVLLIGLISIFSHLTSQILGIAGLQSQYRLLSTTVWGLCYMSAFIWSVATYSSGMNADVGIMRFPTVCIVGFIPHLLILLGICICAGIYAIAVTISAFALPHGAAPSSFRRRVVMAHENLQANTQMSTLTLHRHDDFYTTLLKIGFVALTAASEAVFLNEGQPVSVRQWTWLEEERLQEIEALADTRESGIALPQDIRETPNDMVVDGVRLGDAAPGRRLGVRWTSGYDRERDTQALKGRKGVTRIDGVGTAERSGRWLMAWCLFSGIFHLITGWFAVGTLKAMAWLGIPWTPRWLRRLAQRKKAAKRAKKRQEESPERQEELEFWYLSEEGVLQLPADDHVDVEVEMRKRLQMQGNVRGVQLERDLDTSVYDWWKAGGWFGDVDSSGDFEASIDDNDDTSSVVSYSTAGGDDRQWESDASDSGSGRTTPTQRRHNRGGTASPSASNTYLGPMVDLLDALTPEDRERGRLLAYHFHNDGEGKPPLTRARYTQSLLRRRARVLTSVAQPSRPRQSGRLSAEDEMAVLEHLIITRRAERSAAAGLQDASSASVDGENPTWSQGASGMGSGGPQCVVCRSNPRTILVWPCRCLSLCEDCRVSLAMNNYGNCVCCRRDVAGFSRLYVP